MNTGMTYDEEITVTTQPAPIVVGYDGSTGSQSGLRWAIAQAARTMAPLRLVEAFELLIVHRPSPGKVVPLEAVRSARQKGLDAVAEGVRLHHPELTIETRMIGGAAAQTLVEAAEDARLVVLGSRGLGGWSGLLVGSVAVQAILRYLGVEFYREHLHAEPLPDDSGDGAEHEDHNPAEASVAR